MWKMNTFMKNIKDSQRKLAMAIGKDEEIKKYHTRPICSCQILKLLIITVGTRII